MKPRRNRLWNVFYHSCEEMPEIQDSIAQIVIASPPYTNRRDGRTLNKDGYLSFVQRVLREAARVLRPEGILVTVNTDLRDHARYNGGRREFNGSLWQKHCALRLVAEGVGFRCIDTKIWVKSLTRNVYRYNFAYIQFFRRQGLPSQRSSVGGTMDCFAPDVWLLEGGTYRRDSRGRVFRDAIHPEIVQRCLGRFTVPGDLVVSPFAGSGTVLSVAQLMGRRSLGYEVDRSLKPLIEESIEAPEHFPAYRKSLSTAGYSAGPAD